MKRELAMQEKNNEVRVHEVIIDPKTDQLLKLFDQPLNEEERLKE